MPTSLSFPTSTAFLLRFLNWGASKLISTARAIAEVDPYLEVEVWPMGFVPEVMEDFLGGLDLVVDACDAPSAKALLRLGARDRRMPLVMETNDRGLLDIERYDLEETEDFLHGRLTAEQLTELAEWRSMDSGTCSMPLWTCLPSATGPRRALEKSGRPWLDGLNCTAMWPSAQGWLLRQPGAFYSGRTSQINASDSISMSSSPSHIPRESVDVARSLREATLHVFASSDDLDLSRRFADGHKAVLSASGISNLTSFDEEWVGDPDTTLFLLTAQDEEVLLSGMRLQKRQKDNALPLERAVGADHPQVMAALR